MWTRTEVKTKGKEAFKGNYWMCVLTAFIISIISGASAAPGQTGTIRNLNNMLKDDSGMISVIIAFIASVIVIFSIVWTLLKIFAINPVYMGCRCFFKENLSKKLTSPDLTESIKKSFTGNYGRNILCLFLKDLFLGLWFCLFIIPGIIKCYSYKMVPYILYDHPELSATEAITYSRKMMDGHKWSAFVLDLSFIGWGLLSLITGGLVGLFWTNPYMMSTEAALYEKLKMMQ